MDKVGFGRALGYGARHAAKSLLAAAEVAAAPNPDPGAGPRRDLPRSSQAAARRPSAQPPSARPPSAQRAASSRGADGRSALLDAAAATARARTVGGEVARHAGRSFFSPLARFSRVVTLQVTGTFFALIALVMGQATWRARAALHFGAASSEARRFYLLATAFLVFSYFAISNFVRAHRRGRR